jgi:hypothetical protein
MNTETNQKWYQKFGSFFDGKLIISLLTALVIGYGIYYAFTTINASKTTTDVNTANIKSIADFINQQIAASQQNQQNQQTQTVVPQEPSKK